jgi:hypothetical protein
MSDTPSDTALYFVLRTTYVYNFTLMLRIRVIPLSGIPTSPFHGHSATAVLRNVRRNISGTELLTTYYPYFVQFEKGHLSYPYNGTFPPGSNLSPAGEFHRLPGSSVDAPAPWIRSPAPRALLHLALRLLDLWTARVIAPTEPLATSTTVTRYSVSTVPVPTYAQAYVLCASISRTTSLDIQPRLLTCTAAAVSRPTSSPL